MSACSCNGKVVGVFGETHSYFHFSGFYWHWQILKAIFPVHSNTIYSRMKEQ